MRRIALVACGVLLWAVPVLAQPTLVGQNATACVSSPTSCQSDAGIAVTAGDLLVGAVGIRGSSASPTISATDATNGAWTCPAGTNIYDGTSQVVAAACYFLASGAATIQPTVSTSGTTTQIFWWFTVFRNAGTWALDQANENDFASGGPYSHGSITTTGSAGVIVTVAAQNASITDETANASFTAGTSLSLREFWQYRLTTGGVTTDGVYTAVTSHDGAGVIISFAASGAGGTPRCLMLMGVSGCE